MRKWIYIFLSISLIFVSCEKEETQNMIDSEREEINMFIESTKLKYENITSNLYKLTVLEVPEETNSVQKGDSVYINYVMSAFSSGRGGVITTNIKEISESSDLGIDNDLLVPFGIKYGSTSLIKGIDIALENSKDLGSYQVIIPFELGYGDKFNGIVSPYTTLFFEYEIINIIK